MAQQLLKTVTVVTATTEYLLSTSHKLAHSQPKGLYYPIA